MREVRCYWMTGLPASGKTALSKAWVDAIKRQGSPATLCWMATKYAKACVPILACQTRTERKTSGAWVKLHA